jgi:hypothetical protein
MKAGGLLPPISKSYKCQTPAFLLPRISTHSPFTHTNISNMPTVLITGLNGFVAVHTAVVFLNNGWNVRGTVRSLEKGEKVKALPVFQDKKDKIELTVVEDLVEGDFTSALKGVDAVSAASLVRSAAVLTSDCPLCFAMAFQWENLGFIP